MFLKSAAVWPSLGLSERWTWDLVCATILAHAEHTKVQQALLRVNKC